MTRWNWLIQHASLSIYEFNVERRTAYQSGQRNFDFYVMSYVQDGEARAIINGEAFEQRKGTLMLMPPHMVHEHYVPEGKGPTTFLWWHFNIRIGMLDILRFVRLPVFSELKNPARFEQLFYRYMQLNERRSTLANLIYRRAAEYEIMAVLLEGLLNEGQQANPDIDDIPEVFFEMMQDIIEHPERNHSLQELSLKYHLHNTYISNKFKRLFGISPMRLHNEVVTEYIKNELLKNTERSITELAEALNFTDVSALTHFFTSRVGCSPTEFRKRTTNGSPI